MFFVKVTFILTISLHHFCHFKSPFLVPAVNNITIFQLLIFYIIIIILQSFLHPCIIIFSDLFCNRLKAVKNFVITILFNGYHRHYFLYIYCNWRNVCLCLIVSFSFLVSNISFDNLFVSINSAFSCFSKIFSVFPKLLCINHKQW